MNLADILESLSYVWIRLEVLSEHKGASIWRSDISMERLYTNSMRTGVNFIDALIVNAYSREAAEKFLMKKQRGYSDPQPNSGLLRFFCESFRNWFTLRVTLGFTLGLPLPAEPFRNTKPTRMQLVPLTRNHA